MLYVFIQQIFFEDLLFVRPSFKNALDTVLPRFWREWQITINKHIYNVLGDDKLETAVKKSGTVRRK